MSLETAKKIADINNVYVSRLQGKFKYVTSDVFLRMTLSTFLMFLKKYNPDWTFQQCAKEAGICVFEGMMQFNCMQGNNGQKDAEEYSELFQELDW